MLVKVLFELALEGCAGGKLFVVLAPNAPPNMPPEAFAPFSAPPPMGADAPKPKLGDGWPPPKFTLCDRPCDVALAARWCRRCRVRMALRCAGLYLSTMAAAVDAMAVVRVDVGVDVGSKDLQTRRLLRGGASPS